MRGCASKQRWKREANKYSLQEASLARRSEHEILSALSAQKINRSDDRDAGAGDSSDQNDDAYYQLTVMLEIMREKYLLVALHHMQKLV